MDNRYGICEKCGKGPSPLSVQPFSEKEATSYNSVCGECLHPTPSRLFDDPEFPQDFCQEGWATVTGILAGRVTAIGIISIPRSREGWELLKSREPRATHLRLADPNTFIARDPEAVEDDDLAWGGDTPPSPDPLERDCGDW